MLQSPQIQKLLDQQAALASFGSFAFNEPDLLTILNEAARVCAACLCVPHCKICMYRPAENDLLIVAGCGWQDGVIGRVVSEANESSPQGRAFVTGKPVIIADIQGANDLALPPFYKAHGIASTVDVLIPGFQSGPYGVLEIDSTECHTYDEYDIVFLTGFANVLAEAVATSDRVRRLKAIIAEKDLLTQEMHHRVRNNFAMISGMLNIYLTGDGEGGTTTHAVAGVQRRITAIARLYDLLVGRGAQRHADIGAYLGLLCDSLDRAHDTKARGIDVVLAAEPFPANLDTVVAIGMVASELIANACLHAFPERGGRIDIALARPGADGGGRLTIADNGTGFVPDPHSQRHGLELVRRLMDKVAGTADFRSGPGGTIWTLDFVDTLVDGADPIA